MRMNAVNVEARITGERSSDDHKGTSIKPTYGNHTIHPSGRNRSSTKITTAAASGRIREGRKGLTIFSIGCPRVLEGPKFRAAARTMSSEKGESEGSRAACHGPSAYLRRCQIRTETVSQA